jgi:hypothetical protein
MKESKRGQERERRKEKRQRGPEEIPYLMPNNNRQRKTRTKRRKCISFLGTDLNIRKQMPVVPDWRSCLIL